ncbi:MAG: hypothetical protein WD595_03510 [Waddliaceae bacterium]
MRNRLKILEKIDRFSGYESMRDFPVEDKTTHLSRHLKFTTCSVREIYFLILERFGAPFLFRLRSIFRRFLKGFSRKVQSPELAIPLVI